MRRRLVAVTFVCLAALSVAGCIPKILSEVGPLGFIYLVLGGGSAKAPKPTRIESSVDVRMDAQIAGVPTGGYDITITRTADDVVLGHFTGTAKIKRQRFVSFTVKDSPELLSAVAAVLRSGDPASDFVITKARAKVSGKQTPGGVTAVATVKIRFSGDVTAGERVGGKIRRGKINFAFEE